MWEAPVAVTPRCVAAMITEIPALVHAGEQVPSLYESAWGDRGLPAHDRGFYDRVARDDLLRGLGDEVHRSAVVVIPAIVLLCAHPVMRLTQMPFAVW